MKEMTKLTPQQEAAALLAELGLTLSLAESCTGGLISARIVSVPGVSGVYQCGAVTYANKAKRRLLGVKKATLKKFGAVSRQTAEEMAKGAARNFGTDVSVSVTGIAGPDGGTPEKPVGLVYIGCCVKGKVKVEECRFTGDRSQIREAAAEEALCFLISCLKKQVLKTGEVAEEVTEESAERITEETVTEVPDKKRNSGREKTARKESALKENKLEKKEKPEKKEKTLKEEKPEKKEKTLKEEKPEKKEKTLKEEKPEKKEKALKEEKPEKKEKALKEEKPEKKEKAEKKEKNNKKEKRSVLWLEEEADA